MVARACGSARVATRGGSARRAARRDRVRARGRERGATASRAMPTCVVYGGARAVGVCVLCLAVGLRDATRLRRAAFCGSGAAPSRRARAHLRALFDGELTPRSTDLLAVSEKLSKQPI